jgi:hypothetical protein
MAGYYFSQNVKVFNFPGLMPFILDEKTLRFLKADLK